MKGLIRNNFYMVSGSLKAMVVFSAVALVCIIIGEMNGSIGTMIISAVIGSQLGGFGALAGTAIQQDATSKWNRFELTLPIKRTDVIKAKYVSFLLFVLIGLVLAIISTILHIAITDVVNFERIGYSFTFGLAFALSIPTFMIPLILIFGADKNEVILFAAVGLGFALFFGSSMLIAYILPIEHNSNLIFRGGYLLLSVILYAVSYLVSVIIYNKKEL